MNKRNFILSLFFCLWGIFIIADAIIADALSHGLKYDFTGNTAYGKGEIFGRLLGIVFLAAGIRGVRQELRRRA